MFNFDVARNTNFTFKRTFSDLLDLSNGERSMCDRRLLNGAIVASVTVNVLRVIVASITVNALCARHLFIFVLF